MTRVIAKVFNSVFAFVNSGALLYALVALVVIWWVVVHPIMGDGNGPSY